VPAKASATRIASNALVNREVWAIIVILPECRCREGEFSSRASLVGRLPGIDTAPESERVVEERLQGLRRQQIADEAL